MKQVKFFKAGDRVKRTSASYRNVECGKVYTVKACDMNGVMIEGQEQHLYSITGFTLHKQLDLGKDRWFIRTPTREQNYLVQEWLFTQGITWRNGGANIDGDNWSVLTNDKGCEYIFKASEGNIPKMLDEGVKEIFITFKTVVDSVSIPDKMSEREMKMKDIERQIKELKAEFDKLNQENDND